MQTDDKLPNESSIPPLIIAIISNEVAGFDKERDDSKSDQIKSASCIRPISISSSSETHSVSISMPSSPAEAAARSHHGNRVFFKDEDGNGRETAKPKDKRFDNFKTWSGKLERQLSNLRGKHVAEPPEEEEDRQDHQTHTPPDFDRLPADRYFAALEGPELDTLRASEEIILPKDEKWPFLLRFPISSFGICLGLSSQAIMWKSLASSDSTKFLNIGHGINLVLWFVSIALVSVVAITYTFKIIFYFEAVRREYYHPIRVNFFFAPFIALLFLALGVPPSVSPALPPPLWYVLMAPFLCLELKIYGQWMSGGQRRLSKVANPSNHLAVVGNFVGALLGASMGLKEGPIFFFAVGLAHYIVLFVTLYQRLPTNETLPRELHPVFFLFVAAPNAAALAWATIHRSFDYGSRIAFFISLFLYFSLAVRVNFFRGFKFSLAWWAYTFPMTAAAITTIRYASVAPSIVTKCLVVALSTVAILTVGALLVTTIIHAFVLKDLFPNDIAIAIRERRPKKSRKWYYRNSGSPDASILRYLKYTSSDSSDIFDDKKLPSLGDQDEPDHCAKVVEP
ncbi:S-type anion channel SLAH2-like [Andrographis paniculata]|uniref:S-type anion channel SLAH2-like n=1 Tax=Andrographis paniculata TaxID=175694 RepID=UPI0021E6F445|nr:S-type anion channel SLAH2-like [Andrographis paniculata]